KAIPGKVRSGFPFGIAAIQKAIPGKVRSGFPSGVASSQKQFQEKCETLFRPELRLHKQQLRKSAKRFPSGIH
ncbi:hypothetical protein, partial [Ensifer sp. LBL]|uniref:hypothetical protein n=1 Tax=Ensifer sp. LBL TaxID=2991056 RepID=UPI003D2015DE